MHSVVVVRPVVKSLGEGGWGQIWHRTEIQETSTDGGTAATEEKEDIPEVKKVKAGTEQQARRLPLMEVLQQLVILVQKAKNAHISRCSSEETSQTKPADTILQYRNCHTSGQSQVSMPSY